MSIRRRNYDLLLKKRDEKKRSRKLAAGQGTSKGNKGSPDMEELLFEQVLTNEFVKLHERFWLFCTLLIQHEP